MSVLWERAKAPYRHEFFVWISLDIVGTTLAKL